MRERRTFRADARALKAGVFRFLRQSPYFVWLDSSGRAFDPYRKYAFWGAAAYAPKLIQTLSELENEFEQGEYWLAGGFGYEANRVLEPKISLPDRPSSFSECLFYHPEVVVYQPAKSRRLVVEADEPDKVFREISQASGSYGSYPFETKRYNLGKNQPLRWQSNFSKKDYLDAIGALQDHIREGDIYEINLTQKYSAEAVLPHPHELFNRLIARSPAPFSACCRFGNFWAASSSPERFLQHSKGRLITQPIKGTIRRSAFPLADQLLKRKLAAAEKFRAENVMIVDLARNDLNRVSEVYSVGVPRLFEAQSFRHLHHLVSTVEGRLAANKKPFEAIKAAFPPGSMTGAPKCSAMELISQFESDPRGLYAGSIGYVSPERDFDFNVVIRTLIYDAAAGALSYHTGGAITYDSDPNEEYEEALLKAKAMRRALAD